MNQTKSISLVSPRAGRWLAVAAVVTSMAVLGGCANRSASSGVYSYDQLSASRSSARAQSPACVPS